MPSERPSPANVSRKNRQMRLDKRYRPQNAKGVNGYAAGRVLPGKKGKK